MNKEDILLLVDYFTDDRLTEPLSKEVEKLVEKLLLIKKQIEAQDIIQSVQKELAEMDKINE